MHRRIPFVFVAISVLFSGCSTPTAMALQDAPTRTPYWAFLWQLQTAWYTLTPPAAETFQPTAPATPFPSPTPVPSLTALPTETAAPTSTSTPVPPSSTPTPLVTSLKATVTAGLLSCRYGPGPEYLYLYALRKGANIKLIGRVDADNWHWAWVDGRNKCWVNTSYLTLDGNWRQLPVVYPGTARLPVSPYYPPTSIISVVRSGDSVTVEWVHIPLRAGDEEDDSMQRYILETWHCVDGRFIFEPLATNDTLMTLIDQAGCSEPSRARLFVQEKHGFSGPTTVPWRPAF